MPYITLNDQLTVVTPQIAREVIQLADELHLEETHALGLYAEAMRRTATTGQGNDAVNENGGAREDQ